jgi:hypothetical protein
MPADTDKADPMSGLPWTKHPTAENEIKLIMGRVVKGPAGQRVVEKSAPKTFTIELGSFVNTAQHACTRTILTRTSTNGSDSRRDA